MADIAFLILVFFLVTTQLERLKVSPLELPSSRQSEKTTKLKNIQINLKGRTAYVGDNRYIIPEQSALLRKFLVSRIAGFARQEDKVVVLQSDVSVSWQTYVTVLEMVKESGGKPAIQTEEIVRVRK